MQRDIVFARLAKVQETDSGALVIQGLATSGKETDRGGERNFYPGSKPFFERWRDSLLAATGGKSQGNIREQHDEERAVGRVDNLIFDDDAQTISIIATIIEPSTCEKIRQGVLSGLSIAGRYIRRWVEDGINWYVCSPCEISVCDYPALPSATFEVVSKSGAVEHRHFQSGENSMNRSDHKEAAKRNLELARHHEEIGKLHRDAHAHHLRMAESPVTYGEIESSRNDKAATGFFLEKVAEATGEPVDRRGGLRRPSRS